MNSVVKFELHFDKDDLTFGGGEYITGFLELILCEDIKYKSICLEVKGYSIISWDGMSNSASLESFDPTTADVFKEHWSEKCIMLDKVGNFLDKDPTLQAGEHVFPFEVKIPKEVPSSFEGQYGRVRYEGRGVIERSSSGFKSNKTVLSRHNLIVLSTLDLNSILEAFYKIEICKYKELGLCCTEGSLTIDWAVEKSGFIPTEQVSIMGSIQNDSKHAVASSSVSLIMVVEYRLKKRKLIDRVRIANLERGLIRTDDVTVWNDNITIPSCPPSSLGRSKLIDISYELEFKVTMENNHSSPITYNKTIYIGTVVLARLVGDSQRPPTIGYALSPPLVAAEATLLVPCYPENYNSLQTGVVLTSPVRTNDIDGFYGNCNAGFVDPYGRGSDDVPFEARPPPYAPGHNPEEVDFLTGVSDLVREPCLTVEPYLCSNVETDFAKTVCVRGQNHSLRADISAAAGDDDDGNVNLGKRTSEGNSVVDAMETVGNIVDDKNLNSNGDVTHVTTPQSNPSFLETAGSVSEWEDAPTCSSSNNQNRTGYKLEKMELSSKIKSPAVMTTFEKEMEETAAADLTREDDASTDEGLNSDLSSPELPGNQSQEGSELTQPIGGNAQSLDPFVNEAEQLIG